jgi:hypothetical protein
MPLRWDVTKVKNYRDLCFDRLTPAEAQECGTTTEALLAECRFMAPAWCRVDGAGAEEVEEGTIQRISPVTHCLIFGCVGIGMSGITEDNLGEFIARVALMQKLHGPYLSSKDPNTGQWEGRPITVAEIQAHTGITVNVPEEPWVVWTGRIIQGLRSGVLQEAKLKDPRDPDRLHCLAVSQSMRDLAYQLDTLEETMGRRCCFGHDGPDHQHERDYDQLLDTREWLRASATKWEAIEASESEEE